MNNKIRDRPAFGYNGIYLSIDKITQKVFVPLPENQSLFINQSSDLSHTFSCDLEQNQTGVIIKGKCPHYPEFSNDIIRIQSVMIYSDIIENNTVGNTKTPLLRCIPFISKLKSGENFYHRKIHELSVF